MKSLITLKNFKTGYRNLILLLGILLGPVVLSAAGLSGTYTIDPSGSGSTNYKTFKDAVADLMSNGVKGAVTFKVADGVYNEQVEIKGIPGASTSNNIVFESKSLDSTKVNLTYASGNSAKTNYTLQLDSASFITFRKMTISRTGTNDFAQVVRLQNGCNYNNFLNLVIRGQYLTTNKNDANLFTTEIGSDSNNTYKHNHFLYGNFGLVLEGGSSDYEYFSTISDNKIDSFYYVGLFLQYGQRTIVTNNWIGNCVGTYGYGIYMYYNNDIIVTKNYVHAMYYGIMSYYTAGNSGSQATIANNMIILDQGGYYAVYLYYSSYVDFVFNSISHNSSNGYPIYYYSNSTSGTNIENNNFYSKSKNPAYYIYSNKTVNSSNYNSYFTNGTTLANWDGTACPTLSDLQSTNSMDANSVNADPIYHSSTDLHAYNPAINGAANYYSTVKDDFDGQTRNTSTPDIGADEFTPPSNDAGVASIDSPTIGFCAGSKAFYVKIRNYGVNTLTSATIDWSVNGNAQTSYSWKGAVKSGDVSGLIKLGNFSFSAGASYDVIVYTSSPNGATDGNNKNDTMKKLNLQTGMSGTYTIGGTTPDYNTFADATTDLDIRGVCGAVVFNVRNGVYNEKITLNEIGGTSASNTVTFQSQTLDSTKVTVTSTGTVKGNWVLGFEGADWVTFKKITLKANTSNVVDMKGGSHHNTITNCRMIGDKAMNYMLFYSGTDKDSANTISNNWMKYGQYGIYMYYYGTYEQGNTIKNNIIDSINYYAIFVYYQEDLMVSGNTVKNIQQQYGMGIYSVYNRTSLNITKNNLNVENGGYGIYVANYNLTSSFTGSIANNMVSVGGSSNSNGIYVYYGDGIDIYHNSVNIYGTNTSSYCYYGYSNSTSGVINIENNIFYNNAGGLTSYINGTSAIGFMNYNDLYTTGSNFGNWGGTVVSDFASWKSTTSKDANSVSADPVYASNKNLHVSAKALDSAATPLKSIKDDIDGQVRNSTRPDIGADEFVAPNTDAGVISIDSPAMGFCYGKKDVYVSIKNYGVGTLTSVKINWEVNGTAQTSYTWTGSLKQSKTASVKIGSFTFGQNVNYDFKTWTSSPNGTTDQNATNDTTSTKLGDALNGTYTIGGTTPDFKTFTEAVDALNNRGVCGKTVFNVRNGVYVEKFSIFNVSGASSSNTITFQSQSANTASVSLEYPANNTYPNTVVNFAGGDYITFKDMTVQSTGNGYYGFPFYLSKSSTNNTFTNLVVNNGGMYSYPFYIYGYNATCDNTTISKCWLYGGSYSIYSYGYNYPGKRQNNLVIEGNVMDSFTNGGLLCYYDRNATITGNTIISSINSGTGLYVYYTTESVTVTKNDIRMNEGGYGMYLYGNSYNPSTMGLVANNFVSVNCQSATEYGIYAGGTDSTNFYHNSINMYGTGTTSYSFYCDKYYQNANTSVFKDNNCVNKAGGYAIYDNAAALLSSSDYNNYYVTGKYLGYYNGTDVADIANWKSTSGYDNSSISVDPSFYSNTNLHVKNSKMNNLGTPVGVKDDIDGQSRSASTPDMGADEFSASPNDLAIKAILSPSGKNCGDSNTVVAVIVENMGSANQSNITITTEISGAYTTTLTDKISINAGVIDTVYYSTKLNTYAGGTYYFKSYHSLNPDVDKSNDTLTSTAIFTKPASLPSSSDAYLCKAGKVTLVATHAPGLDINWYTSPSGGSSIYKGDSFTTSVSSTTTFYAEASNQSGSLCPSLRIAVKVSVGGLASTIYKDTTNFNGMFNKGTSANPDEVCPNNTVGYWLKTSLSDASFGTAWTIKNMTFATAKGTVSSNISYNFPSSSGPAKFTFTPSSSEQDSVFILFFTVHDNTYGCDSNIIRYIHVAPIPKAKFTTSSSCESAYTMFMDGSTGTISSYVWDFGDGNKGSGKNTSHIYTAAGNYTASLKVISSAGCEDSTSMSITVTKRPVANFGATSACAGKSISFTDSSTSKSGTITKWYYVFGDGGSASYANPTHIYTYPGNYTAKLSIENSNGCKDSIIKTVVVTSGPTATYTDNGDVCLGNASVFSNTSGGTGNAYYWEFGDGNTSTTTSPTHTYTKIGTYHVKLTASNGGCIGIDTSVITVNEQPSAGMTSVDSACSGTAISFKDATTGASGLSWYWRFGDGGTSNLQNPSHTYTTTGSKVVTLIVQAGTGCVDTATKTITVLETPVSAFTNSTACLNQLIQFTDASTISGGTLNYLWDFGDGSATSTLKNPTHTFSPAGSYDVSLTTTTALGCSNKLVKKVSVSTLPIATFSKNVFNKTATFTPTDATSASYKWKFGNGDSSSVTSPSYNYTNYGHYLVTLTVTNSAGCTKTYSDSVFIKNTGISSANNAAVYNVKIFPNPFTEATGISYYLNTNEHVSIKITDVTGRTITTLTDAVETSGLHRHLFDGNVAAGVYRVQLTIGDAVINQEIVKVK